MKKIFLYILPLLLLASCANDDLSVSSSQDDTEGVKATFSLKVDHSSAFATRSSTNAAIDTMQIKNVWVVQFTYTADGTGGLMGTPQYLDNVTDFSSSNMEVKLKEGTGNIYFVANTFNSATFNSANCATESSFRNLTKSFTTDTVMQNELVNSNQCVPMTGVLTNETVSSIAAVAKIVNMYRSAALVDFNYSIAFPTGQSFEVTGIRVCNVPKRMYYAKPSSTSFASTDYYDYPLEEVLTANSQAGHALFYVPDNLSGTGAVNTVPTNKAGIDGKYCTYVELRGKSGDGRYMIYKVYLGKDSVMDYNVERNNYYKVDLTLKGISAYDACMSSAEIMPESNCYMVVPGQMIAIPVSRANSGRKGLNYGSLQYTDIIVKGTVWTSDLLWTDSSNGLSTNGAIESVTADVPGGYIWVKAGKVPGNGAVYAMVGSTIVWSWHIWVTDYVPKETNSNSGTTYSFNNRVWMDRNIGATTATLGLTTTNGFLYEWGRKDPFPGGDMSGTATTPQKIFDKMGTELTEGASGSGVKWLGGPVDPILAVNNPLSYYYRTDAAPNNWSNYSVLYTTFWGGASSTTPTSKTVYDPCPSGWRVPVFINSVSPWIGLSLNNRVWNEGADWRLLGAGFYPALGYRNATGIHNVGTEATCWSGTIGYNTASSAWHNGINILITESTLTDSRSSQSSSGFAVRCIKE